MTNCKPASLQLGIQTVLGPIKPPEMGKCLPHEHVMVDFVGADKVSPDRYVRAEVITKMAPYLHDLVKQGVKTFVDCTPDYLGRDVEVLRQLSTSTGLHIVTNTGWYKEPFLPARATTSSAEQISAEWIQEWQHGIGNTGIKPGFIKIAVHPGPLAEMQRKIVRAAALTHLATGLPVACHTGEAVAANECLDIVEEAGMPLTRYIIVHSDQMPTWEDHESLLKRGAWLEYDAIGTRPLANDLTLIKRALDAGYIDQLLLSQDAGWYDVVNPGGVQVRPFTGLFGSIVPALFGAGVTGATIDILTVANPARVFSVLT